MEKKKREPHSRRVCGGGLVVMSQDVKAGGFRRERGKKTGEIYSIHGDLRWPGGTLDIGTEVTRQQGLLLKSWLREKRRMLRKSMNRQDNCPDTKGAQALCRFS